MHLQARPCTNLIQVTADIALPSPEKKQWCAELLHSGLRENVQGWLRTRELVRNQPEKEQQAGISAKLLEKSEEGMLPSEIVKLMVQQARHGYGNFPGNAPSYKERTSCELLSCKPQL